MILDLIRHGATASTIGHRFNDHEHEPLADEAIAVLGRLAFDSAAYDRIDVSPLRRAAQTAEGLGLSGFAFDSRLAERGLGVFRGLTEQQCRARFPADIEAFNRFEPGYCIPDGESRGQHLARVLSWLEEASVSGARQALAVTHGGVIDFVRRLGRSEPIHGPPFDGGGLLALSRFEIAWPQVRLLSFAQPLPGAWRPSRPCTRA